MNIIDLLFNDYKEYPKEDGYGISELYDSELWCVSELVSSTVCSGSECPDAKCSATGK